jgi:hypothetical protein
VQMALAIIVVAVTFILVASGFAIVFVYFPRWMMHRYKVNGVRKMTAYFALAGLLVSIAFTCGYFLTHSEMVTEALLLWPTALILMDMDGHASISATIANFGLAILSNVGLYAWLGAVVAWMRNHFHKHNPEV